MESMIFYSIFGTITAIALIISHIMIRKSIAKDAKDAVGTFHQLYIDKEWEDELVIEDPRLEQARRLDERFENMQEVRESLELHKHQEARRRRALEMSEKL